MIRAPLKKLSKLKGAVTPLSRLELDINASFYQDQMVREPSEAVKKSLAAIRSESFRGDVQLPKELLDAVDQAITDANDNPSLRTHALELYAHLRLTAPILAPPSSFRDRQALTTTYDAPTSLAYLAGLMPSVYAATVHTLTMTKDRLGLTNQIKEDEESEKKGKEITWEPERIIDYGSGTSSAAFAFNEVFGPRILTGNRKGEAREYVGLEWSSSMVELASKLLGNLQSSGMLGPEILEGKGGKGGELPIKLEARVHQLSVPAHESALAKLNLSSSTYSPAPKGKKTLAIAAFALADQGTKERRKDLVAAMWDSNAEVIVLIDRGTPGGSRMILEAREHLLMLGRRNAKRELYEGEITPAKGCFVLAPCPHDGDCPLFHSTKQWCHFSQRVRSPPFLRYTKHSTKGESDAVFSYVVIQRGSRPIPLTQSSLVDNQTPVEGTTTVMEDQGTVLGTELSWPRIIAPPRKRSGHILLDVCAKSGILEQHTIPKSQGRQEYYDARKVAWGDSFPHAPKHPAKLMEVWTEEKEGNKGLKMKLSKKESRRGGMEKKSRNGKEEEDFGGGGGIQEYEMELDSDGNLKFVD